MSDFKTAYLKTAIIEGGYANDASDTGGETWKGISRNNEKNWPGWAIIDSYKSKPGFPKNLYQNTELQNLVLQVYRRDYWNALGLDGVQDQKIANALYDTAVNCGVNKAAMLLQEALNLTNNMGRLYPDIPIDGKIGPMTIKATNSNPRPALLLKVLNVLQGEYYLKILRHNPTQEVFANTWFSRVEI